jgi:hypothetical protein
MLRVPNKILDMPAKSLYTVPGIGGVAQFQTDVFAAAGNAVPVSFR